MQSTWLFLYIEWGRYYLPPPSKNFQKNAKLTINISYVTKETSRTYLSWLQSASINSAKSSFAKQILFTEWICCLFHFPECENWSMVPFCVFWGLIFKLPKLHRFINPWKLEDMNVIWLYCGEAAVVKEVKNIQGSVWSWDLLLRRLFHAETNPKGIMASYSFWNLI